MNLPLTSQRFCSISSRNLAGLFPTWALSSALWCGLAASQAFASQPISYLVDVRDPPSHLVRVTMTIPQAPPRTEIQFPAWNNLYLIRDFVRNVQDLESACDGQAQQMIRVDLHTWHSRLETCKSLEVRYVVYANEEGPYSSVLNEEHMFLNFALILFYLPQERERNVRVKFLLPAGWKLATLLEEGESPGEFKALNYDLLVDSPAEAGKFQEHEYTQGGATYRVIVHAQLADYSSDRLLSSLQKITAAATALMRDIPFSRYTFILHFPRSGGGGGMEHRHGTAISMAAPDLARHWDDLEATFAHEFFHLWNVKRIRPQSLEPIDYIQGNETRDLWFCEGVTSAYAQLILLRAGLISRQTFYQRLADKIENLQRRPARHFQSVATAGLEAWLEKYTDYLRPARSISYYDKGALLGFLLDLAIRHASHNQNSLDDVMRRLNQDFARRGRFFTQADLRALIAERAPGSKGLDTFFRDYVENTRELDYETHLGFAGLRLHTATRERAALGFHAVRSFDGPIMVESVDPGSNAQKASIQPGDILVKMNGEELTRLPESLMAETKPGKKVKFQVRREGRNLSIEYALGTQKETSSQIEEISDPTAEQLQVREGWLQGKTSGSEGPLNQ